MKRKTLVMMLSLTLVAAGAIAAESVPSSVKTLEEVSVQGVRNPQEFDAFKAKRLHDRLDRVPLKDRDKIALSFYAKRKGASSIDLSALRLDLVTTFGGVPVELTRGARLRWPSLPEAVIADAKLVANEEKGSLSIIYKIDIVPPSEQPMTLGYLKDAGRQASIGWKAVYGRLAALTVPVFTCAQFEFLSPQSVVLKEGQHVVWTSPSATTVQVPLAMPGATSQTLIGWSSDSLVRIGGCKLSSSS